MSLASKVLGVLRLEWLETDPNEHLIGVSLLTRDLGYDLFIALNTSITASGLSSQFSNAENAMLYVSHDGVMLATCIYEEIIRFINTVRGEVSNVSM